jgi:hypothetical protein
MCTKEVASAPTLYVIIGTGRCNAVKLPAGQLLNARMSISSRIACQSSRKMHW